MRFSNWFGKIVAAFRVLGDWACGERIPEEDRLALVLGSDPEDPDHIAEFAILS